MAISFLHGAGGSARKPAPRLDYAWFANSQGGTSLTSLRNSGTVAGSNLVSSGGAIALVAPAELRGLKVLAFTQGGDFLRTAQNFPLASGQARTFYLAFRFNGNESNGDIFGLGVGRDYATNFTLCYEGQNDPSGLKIIHLGLAYLDWYVGMMSIGQWVTMAIRAEPIGSHNFKTTIMFGDNGYAVKQDYNQPLNTDAYPFLLGNGRFTYRTPDMHLAFCGANLKADSDPAMSNNLRQMQLACGLPARSLV